MFASGMLLEFFNSEQKKYMDNEDETPLRSQDHMKDVLDADEELDNRIVPLFHPNLKISIQTFGELDKFLKHVVYDSKKERKLMLMYQTSPIKFQRPADS